MEKVPLPTLLPNEYVSGARCCWFCRAAELCDCCLRNGAVKVDASAASELRTPPPPRVPSFLIE